MHKIREIATSDDRKYLILLGLGVICLIAYLLFGTISIKIDCDRFAAQGPECTVVRQSLLLTMMPVRIPEPLAVDISKHHKPQLGSQDPYVITYKVEMRTTRYQYAVPIYSTRQFKIADHISTDVNNFLLHSQEASFSKRYP